MEEQLASMGEHRGSMREHRGSMSTKRALPELVAGHVLLLDRGGYIYMYIASPNSSQHVLVSEELSKWQQIQPRKIASNTEDEAPQVASLPSYFNRIRRLDPPRDRLASLPFLNVSPPQCAGP